MKPWMLAISTAAWLCAGTALADTDCDDPVANWQSRDTLRQQLEDNGWKVKRIRVDDGCYEVKGIDRIGNRFEAKFSPASLQIRKLEIHFHHPHGRASDYLDKADVVRGHPPRPAPAPESNSREDRTHE